MFPDVDFGHFLMNFIAREQFLCTYNMSLDVDISIKMKQIFLKMNQMLVFVFPESFPIEMCGMGIKPNAFRIKYYSLIAYVGNLQNFFSKAF